MAKRVLKTAFFRGKFAILEAKKPPEVSEYLFGVKAKWKGKFI
jgi:hypothetical protein